MKRTALLLLSLLFQIACTMNSEENKTQTSPLEFKKLLRRDATVGRLAIEYAFTPPVPTMDGWSVILVYMTPGLPPRGFRLNAPDYLISAQYPSGVVRSLQPVTPAQLTLAGRDLGLLHVVNWSYEEGEASRNEFDRIYSKLIDSFAMGGKGFPSEKDCHRFKELWPLFVPEQLLPALRHASPKFMEFADHCASE